MEEQPSSSIVRNKGPRIYQYDTTTQSASSLHRGATMSSRGIQRAACAALGLMLRASNAQCPPGVTAPAYITIMKSTENPDTEAWMVEPDCVYTVTGLLAEEEELVFYVIPRLDESDFTSWPADRIESIPNAATRVEMILTTLPRGADFSGATNLKTIYMYDVDFAVDNLKLPSSLETLEIRMTGSNVASIDKLDLPDSITSLAMNGMGISSLESLPSNLITLNLVQNAFTAINFPIPPKLDSLIMAANPITTLENLTFPETLTYFTCFSCDLTTIRGVKWPHALADLELELNPLVEFELRQSDYDFLSKQSTIELSTNLVACSDKEATVLLINTQEVCVISDERFEVLYRGATATPSDSSASSSGDESAGVEAGSSSENRSTGSNGLGSSEVGSDKQPLDSPSSTKKKKINASGTNGDGSAKEESSDPSTSSLSSTAIAAIIAVSFAFGIVFAFIGYRRLRLSRRRDPKEECEISNDTLMTPAFNYSQDLSPSTDGSSEEYLTNDIRNDKMLIPYRIDEEEITLSKPIARGGFGVIYRGSFNCRAVAVKQMLPDALRNETHLASFMDEIRLCASLSHPKIVEFVGVTWTSLRDISVISEFMDGGDLYEVLQRHAQAQSFASASQVATSPREWFEPWTTASINSKTRIARDVAEAVVYLHSFSNPIVHRDLKARNVLLDISGNAKLSDFGISREIAVDETMTSEVGTSAWIAPEVLRGDRYSERADIYSFGVLLVELDKCRHPYAGEDTMMMMDGISLPTDLLSQQQETAHGTHTEEAHPNMQIVMLVSAGHLHPRPTKTCPARVRMLIERCLSFAPEDRPSAMEAHNELRQIVAEM